MVLLTTVVWFITKNKKIGTLGKLAIGIIFGLAAVASTHWGIIYNTMVLNVRDIAPLSAGLFFGPVPGILAGLIGGIERYIAGTYFGVGSYTRIACSISTCLAGFISAAFNRWMFKGKKPTPFYAFALGAVTEVFHMLTVLVTHRGDMDFAMLVVDTCAIPMIVFTAIGMILTSFVLWLLSPERGKLHKPEKYEISISMRLQAWLVLLVVVMFIFTFAFSQTMQRRTIFQNAQATMRVSVEDAKETLSSSHVGKSGTVYIADTDGMILSGEHKGEFISSPVKKKSGSFYSAEIFGNSSYCLYEQYDDYKIFAVMPDTELYNSIKASGYETAFADILLFALIFLGMYILVEKIVVRDLGRINASLAIITRGNLDEVVNVNSSSEFASLSRDINQTVDALKMYIAQAENRIHEELEFARKIQSSALPKVFKFQNITSFEVFASMDPAKEVGGDFYDLFFSGPHKLALVVADVSGKGIPAALFMMQSKTAIKSLAESGLSPKEIFERANNELCKSNEANMFVTAWIGIIDIETGIMRCANAGHEYPAIMRASGRFELFKDKHGLALACMEGIPYSEYEIKLDPGDKLFTYTDGVPEATNENDEQFGTERMLESLNHVKSLSVDKTLPFVRERIAAFAGSAEQFDDITMLGFEFKGNEAK